MASSAFTRSIVGIEAFLPQSNQKSVSMIYMGAVVHLNYLDSNFSGNRDIGSLVLCNSCAPHCCSKQQALGDTGKVSADW
jgi:hypothetical protein